MSKLPDPSSSDLPFGMVFMGWHPTQEMVVPMPSQHYDGHWTGRAAQLEEEVLPRSEGASVRKSTSGNLRWLLQEDFWSGFELL